VVVINIFVSSVIVLCSVCWYNWFCQRGDLLVYLGKFR